MLDIIEYLQTNAMAIIMYYVLVAIHALQHHEYYQWLRFNTTHQMMQYTRH